MESNANFNKKYSTLSAADQTGIFSLFCASLLTDWAEKAVKLFGVTSALHIPQKAYFFGSVTPKNITGKREQDLAMKYRGEVFADVYAGIHRGRANTAKAKQIMDSQTTEIQRAAQNRKAMRNKTAPPEQQYSLSPTKRGKLEKEIDRLGEERIAIFAGEKRIVVLTDDFTKDKAIYSQKGRTKKEVNARIKAIPEFGSIIRRSKFERTDTDVRNLESKAKKGVIAMQHFSAKHDGFDVDIVIRDKGKT